MNNRTRLTEPRSLPFVVPDTDDCCEWHGTRTADGYGHIWVDGKHLRVHRVAYETFVQPIPDGLQIDHLCRNRACWNPRHLEAVTQKTNILRGEAWSAVNARKPNCPTCNQDYVVDGRGDRVCRPCRSRVERERYWKNKEQS